CQMDETEPGPTGITFLTDNILADYERMQEMGVEFRVPPERMEWGEWLGQFADPDGNVFDLKQPISTRDWKGQPPADEPPTRPRVKRARRARASPAGGRGRRTRRPHRTAPAWRGRSLCSPTRCGNPDRRPGRGHTTAA